MTTGGTNTRANQRYIQLDARNEGGIVTITPQDQDRFSLRVNEAIAACQNAHNGQKAHERFQLLLRQLGEWVLQRDDIEGAWVTSRDHNFAFVVVSKSTRYNAELQDALAALELQIARDADIRMVVDVIGLPNADEDSLSSFLCSDFALRFTSNR